MTLTLGMADGLYAVSWPGVCASFEIRGGKLYRVAPILRRKLDLHMRRAKRIAP